MPEPWFLYLPLTAAHTPWTPPPSDLLPEPLPDRPTDIESFHAVLQAADRELGRFLDELGPGLLERTTVIVMGDNGTPSLAVDERYDPERQKHTVYEGGVHVPLIVTGPHVATPGRTTDALVHLTDIFPTVAEIAGVPLLGPDGALLVDAADGERRLDGRSWLSILEDPDREGADFVYTEAFLPNGTGTRLQLDRRMVRDDRFKLVRIDLAEFLFDLEHGGVDPDGEDLLLAPLSREARAAHERLSAQLDALEEEIQYEGW
jgi:arylsulfatase A-like enzyme